jgi:hypothetical protein
MRYSRVCAQYSDFLDRVQLLPQKLLKQRYVAPRLKSSQQKFYGRHHHWLTIGKYPYLKWQWIFYFLRMCVLSSITTKIFDQTWLYIRVTRRVSYKKQELFTHRERLSSPQVKNYDWLQLYSKERLLIYTNLMFHTLCFSVFQPSLY